MKRFAPLVVAWLLAIAGWWQLSGLIPGCHTSTGIRWFVYGVMFMVLIIHISDETGSDGL